jgi:hypothetical protein
MTSGELGALERRRNTLKSSVRFLGSWLIIAIVGVVVGLGIELYKPIVTLYAKFDLGTLVELIGVVLVTLGVAGELAVEWATHRRERELLRIDAVVEREDKRQLAELNLLAEQEQLSRLKIENRLVRLTVRRELDESEMKALEERLLPLAGQRFAITVAPTDDAATVEPQLFSWQLAELLRRANWIGEQIPPVQRPGQGVLIECDVGDMGSAMALATALATVGIQAKAAIKDSEQLQQLRIHVGLL